VLNASVTKKIIITTKCRMPLFIEKESQGPLETLSGLEGLCRPLWNGRR
jgi:hypothetical protein